MRTRRKLRGGLYNPFTGRRFFERYRSKKIYDKAFDEIKKFKEVLNEKKMDCLSDHARYRIKFECNARQKYNYFINNSIIAIDQMDHLPVNISKQIKKILEKDKRTTTINTAITCDDLQIESLFRNYFRIVDKFILMYIFITYKTLNKILDCMINSKINNPESLNFNDKFSEYFLDFQEKESAKLKAESEAESEADDVVTHVGDLSYQDDQDGGKCRKMCRTHRLCKRRGARRTTRR